MQVEEEDSKLLILETFSCPLFFTWMSYRGARAPKNYSKKQTETNCVAGEELCCPEEV